MAIVEINDSEYEEKHGKKLSYYIDDRLKAKSDEKIKKVIDYKDKDFFAIVDGGEGAGKSTFAFQWAKYVDPSFCLSRIVFSPEEFKEAIFKAKKGQAIVYDEAFSGLGSRSALSSINRYLVSLAMQIRQKNLFVILVLPSVFLLDKYFVMFRAKVLVHVYENHGVRGYFRVYSPKKIKYLILLGKSTYSYSKKVRTRFKGRFYGKFALGEEVEEKYRKVKMKSLEQTESNPMTAGQVKYKDQRDLSVFLLRKTSKMTYQEIANMLLDYGIDISYVQIRNICVKFGDIAPKEPKEEKKSSKVNKKKENDDSDEEEESLDEESDEKEEFNEEYDYKDDEGDDIAPIIRK